MTKNALRQHFKQQRLRLSNDFRTSAAQAICDQWRHSGFSFMAIGSYLATDVECPTTALHDLWWQQQRRVFIPLISQSGVFRELNANSVLTKTHLGIDEPLNGPMLHADSLDIMIIPLLAIDQNGYRLGYGGGFYDQLLAKCTKKPLLIGLGFFEQFIATLPHDTWDVPMDGFLSEQGWHFF